MVSLSISESLASFALSWPTLAALRCFLLLVSPPERLDPPTGSG
jgi:hypothetical protein